MYRNDPSYHTYQPVKRVRLWPWFLSGLILALGLVAYCEPIPSHTTAQPVSLGPNSPLYGPMQGGTAIPLAPGQ